MDTKPAPVDSLCAEAAIWAASVVVEEMKPADLAAHHSNNKQTAISHFKAKLEMCGVKVLKKPQLQVLWTHLKHSPFVLADASIPSIRKGDKVDVWKRQIALCLALDGAKQLLPIGSASAPALPVPAAASIPIAASLPGAAAAAHPPHLPMGNSPRNYLLQQIQQLQQQQNHNQQQQQHRQQRQYQQLQEMLAGRGQYPFAAPPFPSPRGQYASAPSRMGNNPAGYGAASMAYALPTGNGARLSSAGSSRKRKSSGASGLSDEDDSSDSEAGEHALHRAMMASLNGSTAAHTDLFGSAAIAAINARRNSAAAPTNGGSPPLSPVEQKLLSQLFQMGFDNKDRKECLDAIRRALEKAGDGDVPAVDAIMIDIVTQREEAEEAKKMDMARKASEMTNREEGKRLREQRNQNKQEALKNASFEELRSPSSTENHRLMFPESWLLRHEECVGLLTQIANDKEKYSECKDHLIKILQMEKNAKRWYKAGNLPKWYFTFELGKLLLEAHAAVDPKALQNELARLATEIEECMSLQVNLTKDGIPLIFENARAEHKKEDAQAAGENTGDDDDDIMVLTEEEVRQMHSQDGADTATGMDTASGDPVIEMA